MFCSVRYCSSPIWFLMLLMFFLMMPITEIWASWISEDYFVISHSFSDEGFYKAQLQMLAEIELFAFEAAV